MYVHIIMHLCEYICKLNSLKWKYTLEIYTVVILICGAMLPSTKVVAIIYLQYVLLRSFLWLHIILS